MVDKPHHYNRHCGKARLIDRAPRLAALYPPLPALATRHGTRRHDTRNKVYRNKEQSGGYEWRYRAEHSTKTRYRSTNIFAQYFHLSNSGLVGYQ